MDRFRELSTFVAVAEEGVFNAAARRLHMSPPAVTRFVTSLESRLGVRLFSRTTRQVALTDAGRRLHADAIRVLADMEAAERSAAGDHDVPRGVLRITAPVLFGERFVAPILRDYLDAHPAVTADALFVDRVVNLIDEGLDIAVRIGDLPDSSLAATRVGAVRRMVVASPEYLEHAGVPQIPDDLKAHRIILPTSASSAPAWEFVSEARRSMVRLQPGFSVNGNGPAIDAAAAGWGLTRVLSYQVADMISSGELVEVLADAEDREMPIHLMHSEGRRAAAKVRSFIDLAARRLRRDSARLSARDESQG